MWKFWDFSIPQILREIDFWDSRSAKSAIFTHLEAMNFGFYEFFHFLKAEISRAQKTAVLELLESPKIISRENVRNIG